MITLATFTDRRRALEAGRAVEELGLPARVRVDDPRDAAAAHRAHQTDEAALDTDMAGPVPMTGAQARGALGGALLGALLGMLALGWVGFVWQPDGLDVASTVLLFAVIGALGFGASGFVFGGALRPDLEGATEERDRHVVAVEIRDAEEEQVIDLRDTLERGGAVHIVERDL
jgi:hypothetical protein